MAIPSVSPTASSPLHPVKAISATPPKKSAAAPPAEPKEPGSAAAGKVGTRLNLKA